mmetsp:Transcript_93774/g.274589  ORF Transcript_93774/g.274589 Transcript_93774/m.274589 type:complete len:444 (+) Transcript_93774:145-1476(+)
MVPRHPANSIPEDTPAKAACSSPPCFSGPSPPASELSTADTAGQLPLDLPCSSARPTDLECLLQVGRTPRAHASWKEKGTASRCMHPEEQSLSPRRIVALAWMPASHLLRPAPRGLQMTRPTSLLASRGGAPCRWIQCKPSASHRPCRTWAWGTLSGPCTSTDTAAARRRCGTAALSDTEACTWGRCTLSCTADNWVRSTSWKGRLLSNGASRIASCTQTALCQCNASGTWGSHNAAHTPPRKWDWCTYKNSVVCNPHAWACTPPLGAGIAQSCLAQSLRRPGHCWSYQQALLAAPAEPVLALRSLTFLVATSRGNAAAAGVFSAPAPMATCPVASRPLAEAAAAAAAAPELALEQAVPLCPHVQPRPAASLPSQNTAGLSARRDSGSLPSDCPVGWLPAEKPSPVTLLSMMRPQSSREGPCPQCPPELRRSLQLLLRDRQPW